MPSAALLLLSSLHFSRVAHICDLFRLDVVEYRGTTLAELPISARFYSPRIGKLYALLFQPRLVWFIDFLLDDEYKIITLGTQKPTTLDLFLPRPNSHGDRIVKFKAHTSLELPSRELLQTRAALAKVLHASGMAETIHKIIEERDELKCLASNGSTNVQ
jgi:hypothetical protein